ncbi:hypothetical protein BaRGS_00022432 [Batillaria attramentaria]|uniref:Hexosyltransferase n=1 Tax=Batillaria attramentaria TaxID=370345 RepID=A0ABD0KH84_9CAEN
MNKQRQHLLLALTAFVAMTTVALVLRFRSDESHRFSIVRSLSKGGAGLVRGVRAGRHWLSHVRSKLISPDEEGNITSENMINAGKGSINGTDAHNNVNQNPSASAASNATWTRNSSAQVNVSKPNTITQDQSKAAVGEAEVKPDPVSVPAPTTNRPLTCQNCFWPNYTVLLDNPRICDESSGSKPVLMIVMITSTVEAIDRRQAIRETWASITKNNTGEVRHVFLLGVTPDKEATERLRKEGALYGDILIADFRDVYTNLTLKTMVGLRWITANCGQARFFMKTDQDMYIFMDHLLALLNREETTLKTNLGGSCFQTGRPWRDPKTKYYASVRSYPQSTYPGFCSGTGYVGHMDLARKIVAASPGIPFFHLEDVYVSLVLRHLGLRLRRYEGFATGPGVCKTSRAKTAYTIHEVSPEYMRKFWTEKCGQ